MPSFSDSSFRSADGRNIIHVRRCSPDTAPRAVIQLTHGIAEHVARYDDFAAALAEHGFLVVADDHLGHGTSAASAEDLGFFSPVRGWDMVLSDMHSLYEQTHAEFPGLPYFLLGHSMGSFLARSYLCKYPGRLSGAILSGTGQQPGLVLAAGKAVGNREIRRHGPRYRSKLLNDLAFGSYNKRCKPQRTESDWLCRDTAVVDAYVADPLCGFIPCAGLLCDMLGGMQYMQDPVNLQKMDKALPVLFFAGDADPVGAYGKGVQKAYESFLAAGMQDVSLKLYPGCRHECLNELNKAEVYADVLAWLERKLAAVPQPVC